MGQSNNNCSSSTQRHERETRACQQAGLATIDWPHWILPPVSQPLPEGACTIRRYLPSDVTVKLMFANFIEKGNRCSYETYRKTVKSKNISFTKLGEEECECCLLQDQHVRADHQGEAAEIALSARGWHKHQTEAAETRLHYRSDADKDWPGDTSVRSVDLQKVIMLPRMPGVKSAVFTRRISTYHETFASVGKKQNKRKPSLLSGMRELQGGMPKKSHRRMQQH